MANNVVVRLTSPSIGEVERLRQFETDLSDLSRAPYCVADCYSEQPGMPP